MPLRQLAAWSSEVARRERARRGVMSDGRHRDARVPSRRSGAIAALLAAGFAAAPLARADSSWDLSVLVEDGSPGGWVQVRENEIQGTKLGIGSDLNVQQMQTLRFRATKAFSDTDELRLDLSTSRLDGSTTIAAPVYFNGTTVAPGRLRTVTGFQDFIVADAAYWRRLVAFDNGGGLWGSVGATYDLLNFRLDGTIAADSVGNELKEDFYVQELPVPTIGLHLRYPFAPSWQLKADVTAGRLPWVDSFRTEGGEVRLAQTNEDASIGVEYRFGEHWHAEAYAFHSYFAQHERSNEDGNAIHLTSNGLGIGVGYVF
jgi:hypothetical protein